jgi:hypothetical protein
MTRSIMIHDDDDVYFINYDMAVGYKIYLHTNTDQPDRYKYKMKSIRKIYMIDNGDYDDIEIRNYNSNYTYICM